MQCPCQHVPPHYVSALCWIKAPSSLHSTVSAPPHYVLQPSLLPTTPSFPPCSSPLLHPFPQAPPHNPPPLSALVLPTTPSLSSPHYSIPLFSPLLHPSLLPTTPSLSSPHYSIPLFSPLLHPSLLPTTPSLSSPHYSIPLFSPLLHPSLLPTTPSLSSPHYSIPLFSP